MGTLGARRIWSALLLLTGSGAALVASCSNGTSDCGRTLSCPPADLGSNPGAGGDPTDTSAPAAPRCGDGNVDEGEECDDGNNVDADGCEADCTNPRCGNGIVDPGELCWGGEIRTLGDAEQGISYDSAFLADCDLDGDLDMITSSSGRPNGPSIDTFLNLGDGAFGEEPRISPEVEGNFIGYGKFRITPQSTLLVGGETNSNFDGFCSVSGPPSRLIHQGNCAFARGVDIVGASNFSVTFGQFDGDDLLDIFVGGPCANFGAVLTDTSGSFQDASLGIAEFVLVAPFDEMMRPTLCSIVKEDSVSLRMNRA